MTLLEHQDKIVTSLISDLKKLNIKNLNIINISKLSSDKIILNKSRECLKNKMIENQIATNILDFKIGDGVSLCKLQNLQNLLVSKNQNLINIVIVQNYIKSKRDIDNIINLIEKINEYNYNSSNNQIYIKDHIESELKYLCNSKMGFIPSMFTGLEMLPNYIINCTGIYNHEICSYAIKENIFDKLKEIKLKEEKEIYEENYILKEILINLKKEFIASKIVNELIDLDYIIARKIIGSDQLDLIGLIPLDEIYNIEDEIEKIFDKYFEEDFSEIEEIKQIILSKNKKYPFISDDIIRKQITKQKIKHL